MKKKYIALTVIILMVCILLFVNSTLKGELYQISLENINSDNEVSSLIGKPIKAGYFVFGSISLSGGSGTADISYTVSGSIDSAKVYVVAHKKLGLWKIEEQVVHLKNLDVRKKIIN